MKVWNKFNDFMQNWYMSMPWPKRDFVMGGIGCIIGVAVVLLFAMAIVYYV